MMGAEVEMDSTDKIQRTYHRIDGMTHHEACDAIEEMARIGGPLYSALRTTKHGGVRAGTFEGEGYWLLTVLDVLARVYDAKVSLLATVRGYVARVDQSHDPGKMGMDAHGVTRLSAAVALLVRMAGREVGT